MHIDSKAELSKRSFLHWAVCIASFALWAILAAMVLPNPFHWIADVAGILVAYRVLFYLLEPRPLFISCPKCRKHVATNTPWVCGFCGAKNLRADEVPFIEPCGSCGASAKAYKCHHKAGSVMCEGIIFLSADEQERNHAYCLNSETVAPETPPTVDREEAKAKVAHDIEMAELNEKLEHIRKRGQLMQQKPTRERLKDDFQKDCDVWLGAEDLADEQRVVAREKYKDNPEKLQRALDLIDAWARKHTPD